APAEPTLCGAHLAAPPHCLCEQAKPLLEVLQRVGRAPDDVVHRRARGALVLGDLGERPVAPQREIEDLLLVLGEKGSVPLEKGKVAAPGREAVKAHAFTVYQVLCSLRIGAVEPLLVEAFRYNKWANLHLLDVCAPFTDDQLQMTAPGTYGTIASTFI